ncbi:MAG: sulfatase [Planctomycetes bacterium]|nr:sulfatase [Planctomycetota bacterium]
MGRRRIFEIVVIASMAGSVAAHAAAAKPNIVFILADDLGWTDLGCQGSRYYETPAIDRLASQGMRFTAFHQSQNCAPTRAAMMSGQYPPRTGIYTVNTLARGKAADRRMEVPENVTKLPLDRKTIADQLRAAGYATGMFGKWHLGEDAEHHPSRRGFDEAIVSAGRHFDFRTNPAVEVPDGTYLADFLTDRAVDFIRRHRDHPFFLYLPHFAVHSPFQAKKDLIERFRPKAAAGGHRDPTYAAMIASVDESVARILAALDEGKLAERTVVIFSSDNGGVGGYAEIGGRGITDNAPLRGGKGMLYEGGTRVPFIVRWPGVARPGSACDVPAIHVDVYPTLLEVAGASKPAQVLDGESLAPLFRDPSAKLGRDAIFHHMPGYLEGPAGQWRTSPVGTIQVGAWKLMEFFEDGRLELYDVRADVGEAEDLAREMPEKVKELLARMHAWRRELGAAMPVLKEGDAPAEKKGAAKKKARAARKKA